MRTFVGIPLPDEVRRAVAAAVAPYRTRLRPVAWVAEENLHVTLKFLGDVDPARLRAVEERLALAAASVPPFRFSVLGVGAFPSPGNPRVLWAGVLEPLELVGKLQQNIENSLSGAGIPREERAFHPHATIGRVRGPLPREAREAFFADFSGRAFGDVAAGSFRLYESRLSPAGARYSVLRDFPLRGEK